MTIGFAVVEPEPRHARTVAKSGGRSTIAPKHCACQPCIFGFGHAPLATVGMPALEGASS